MGDRGNIKLVGKPDGEFPTPVCLYTHWRGSDLKDILVDALEDGRSRWTDPPYLARVIFQELVADNGVTGYGLSSSLGDNGHPVLVVNLDEKTVMEESDTRKGFEHFKLQPDSIHEPISYEQFLTTQKKKQAKEKQAI